MSTRSFKQREKAQVTVRHTDGDSHYAYPGAIRTLCGRVKEVQRWIDGREVAFANGQGALMAATCEVCRTALSSFVSLGLERSVFSQETRCTFVTRRGTRCARDVMPGDDACPSHKHLIGTPSELRAAV